MTDCGSDITCVNLGVDLLKLFSEIIETWSREPFKLDWLTPEVFDFSILFSFLYCPDSAGWCRNCDVTGIFLFEDAASVPFMFAVV